MDDVATRKAKRLCVATGRTETVRKFVELSAKELGWNTKINPRHSMGRRRFTRSW